MAKEEAEKLEAVEEVKEEVTETPETEETFAKSGKKSKKHIEEVKAEEERQERKKERAKEEVVITIKEDKIIFYDDGEPIDQNIIDNMFEPFKKGKKGESGIGLSIVKGNCTLIDCSVMAKNKKNGVEFIISKGIKK